MYPTSEAHSSALRVLGEGSREAGCVSVVETRWLPESSRTSEDWRAWVLGGHGRVEAYWLVPGLLAPFAQQIS
jgi:hypothetical protein